MRALSVGAYLHARGCAVRDIVTVKACVVASPGAFRARLEANGWSDIDELLGGESGRPGVSGGVSEGRGAVSEDSQRRSGDVSGRVERG